jgi:hypothetical protein
VASMDLPVWPMYTFPHSQGIRYSPYQQAMSNKISRLLTKYNIKTVHVTITKDRQLLRTAKDDLGLKVPEVYRIPCECGQTGCGAHPASYPTDTRGSLPGGKEVGAWGWTLTSI